MEPAELTKIVRSLLVAAGEAHHQAFAATNGADPEWPAWYAIYLQPRLAQEAGINLSRGKLVRVLVDADRAYQAQTRDTEWPDFYAERLINFAA